MGCIKCLLLVGAASVLTVACASIQDRRMSAGLKREVSVSGTGADVRQDLPELTENSTLDDYLACAALNNPGLRAAYYRWNAALERLPQARALPDPQISYEIETRTDPQRQKFAVAQMFPWFGKLDMQGNMALNAAESLRQRYESEKLALFYRVKNTYYEYYYLGCAIGVMEENLELLKYLESIARARYRVGSLSHSDVIKAQVEIGKVEDQLRTLRDLRSPLVAKLNAELNRPPSAPLPWPESIPEEPATFSNEEVFSWFRENSPELKAIDFLVTKEKIAIDLAEKNFYPDFVLGIGFMDMDDGQMSTGSDAEDAIVPMLSLNLPIWHAKYRAAKREAEAEYTAALNERSERENALSAQLELTSYHFRDAERKIDLYRDSLLPKAEQSLNVARDGFATGAVGFLDLIDAQRILLDFQLSYERALADRAQRLAEMEMLIGKEIPKRESNFSPE